MATSRSIPWTMPPDTASHRAPASPRKKARRLGARASSSTIEGPALDAGRAGASAAAAAAAAGGTAAGAAGTAAAIVVAARAVALRFAVLVARLRALAGGFGPAAAAAGGFRV